MDRRFELPGKAKNIFLGASAFGILLIILGLVINPGEPGRFWANLLLSGFYFTAFSVLALAFIAINYLANAAWAVGLKRIFEAITMFLPVGIAVFAILFLATFIGENNGLHAIYEWTHKNEVAKDVVLQGKSGYLNIPFWITRALVFLGAWTIFAKVFRKYSLNEDMTGGMVNYKKSFTLSAYFMPFFGLSFCIAGWDWLMSVQPHWYSTMFSVNVFAGALVGMLTVTNIIVIIMKKNGQMEWLNENHIHDLSKWMFAFSIFWTYTWVAQYLLIWYANLPEETPYYFIRMHGAWKIVFFTNFILNFCCPFLFFMMRSSKRQMNWVIFVSVLLLIGRFIDWFMIVMPIAAGKDAGFGFYELGFWLLFAGIFAYVVGASMAKANLIAKNHPYLIESLHHEI
jgi:hypothetical protein